jgi:hypothetical protein
MYTLQSPVRCLCLLSRLCGEAVRRLDGERQGLAAFLLANTARRIASTLRSLSVLYPDNTLQDVPHVGSEDMIVLTLCLYSRSAAERAFTSGHFDSVTAHPSINVTTTAEYYMGPLYDKRTAELRWGTVNVGSAPILFPK